jgi:PAS domain S-box-containing protein
MTAAQPSKSSVGTGDLLMAVVFLVIGVAIASAALAVIATFHDGLPQLLVPDGGKVQYDTVWVLFLDSVALIAYALTRRAFAKICAGATILVGALVIFKFFVPRSIATHPLLGSPWLIRHHGEYTEMGIITAVVTVVLGAAIASLLPGAQRSTTRTVFLAALASIAIALSGLLAFGAWSGSHLAIQALQLQGDERFTALIFMVLGAAVLAYPVSGTASERLALGRFAPFIVGLSVFVAVLVVWRAALFEEGNFVQGESQLIASGAAASLERDFSDRIAVLERLADRISIHSFNATVWGQEGESILRNVSMFRTVAWSGPDYMIRWIVPESAAAVGYNILSDPARSVAVHLSTSEQRTTISSFTELVIGGRGLVVYVPAFQNGQFRGTVSSALKPDWLNLLLAKRYPQSHFELIEGGRVEQVAGATAPLAGREWAVEVPMNIYNARWTLRVTPTEAFVAGASSRVPEVGLALGTVLSFLLALATYFYQAARRRARALNDANQRLIEDHARREQAERRLRETEQHNELIVNSVKDCAIYMLDTDGRIASWNRGAQTLNGYFPDEIIGQHFSVLYPSDRETPVGSELVVAERDGWFEEECWHVRKDGTRFCADDFISAVRDDDNQLQGFAVITRDATLRIELREQTERARDHYLSLFSSFPNLVWQSDPHGLCDYVNQAWQDYTGRDIKDLRGNGWLDSVHPDDWNAWRDAIDRLMPGEQPFELEFRLRRADGAYGSIICSARPYRDLLGGFAGYLCSCYDNTARHQAELALKESEERYQRITTNVPGMVFKLERNRAGRHRFLYVSFGCRAVTGLDPAVVTADAEAFFALLHPADRDNLVESLAESGDELVTWVWSGRLSPADGSAEKWISLRAKPIEGDSEVVLWDGVIFDDTQARVAQLELQRSREEARGLSRHLQTVREEEKARIAREVHDELGSTLTGLKIDLDWLIQHQSGFSDEAPRKLAAMHSLLARAVTTTRKIVTDLRPSILDDLGLTAAMRWQISEYQRHSEMHFQLETPDSDIVVDRASALALFRIFQETVTNVVRHAAATEVHITLATRHDQLVLTIHDNGRGIGVHDVGKVTSHGIRGMRERAEQLGGSFSVSGGPGRGTTVVVHAPLAAQTRVEA